ncbi:MAG TPA: amino acid transporter, partial [Chitinophagaceae bacterium]|nr:amino acid transporter [Chitinophagaceae bacterium]
HIAIALYVAFRAFLKKSSAIPVLGALCCLYLMIEIPAVSWLWFFAWMAVGLSIYFLYGRKQSKLA